MFSLIKRFLNFFRTPEPTPAPTPAKPLIEFPWPFPSTEPKNVEYLLGELVRGTETVGEHTFYFWGGEKRRHLRTEKGTETLLARHIVWWMFGRNYPKGTNGLVSNCGEDKCIKLSHLVLKFPQLVHGPQNKPVAKTPVPAPEIVAATKKSIPKAKQHHVLDLSKYDAENRSKCISRKIYFESELEGRQYVNHKKRNTKGKRVKLWVYECEIMDCQGHHLTHKDPKKAHKNKKSQGVW